MGPQVDENTVKVEVISSFFCTNWHTWIVLSGLCTYQHGGNRRAVGKQQLGSTEMSRGHSHPWNQVVVTQEHQHCWPARSLSHLQKIMASRRALLTARWLMLHLFLKARQDTGNCRSAWMIPGQGILCYSWDIYLREHRGVLDKKTALPYVQKVFAHHQEHMWHEKCWDYTGWRCEIGSHNWCSHVHTPCREWSQEQCIPSHSQDLVQVLLVAPKQRLKWSTILHLHLLWISMRLLSLVLLCLAEQKSFSTDHVGSCSSCLSTPAYIAYVNTHLDVGNWACCLY